jgi:hypothetical protein
MCLPSPLPCQRNDPGLHMRQRRLTSRLIRYSVALAALAAACVAPSRVQAACGDYLTMTPHGGTLNSHGITNSMPRDFGMREYGVAAPQTAAVLARDVAAPAPVPCGQCPDGSGSPARVPCQGPWCSGSNAPLTPPTTVVETLQDPWGLCCSAALLNHADSISHAFLRGHSDRVHHVFPIYHPPRRA